MTKEKNINAGTVPYGTVDPYTQTRWNGVEGRVFPNTTFVGMTIGEVRRKYGVYIDRAYIPTIEKKPLDDLVISEGMNIHAWGDWPAIGRFLEAETSKQKRKR